MRSSAVDEDGADASFAGQHLTLLNVAVRRRAARGALREIWWSANSDSAITYRQRVGLFTRPSIGVVVQTLLDPDTAGVMFTQNPVTGADERMIEASWGLGEAVVAGQVIPDTSASAAPGGARAHAGAEEDRDPQPWRVAAREKRSPAELQERLCLDDDDVRELNALADRCEQVYGSSRDIEWAFAGGTLYLLQCRAVTTGRAADGRDAPSRRCGACRCSPTSSRGELEQVARLFKERRFSAGETVVKEGAAGRRSS